MVESNKQPKQTKDKVNFVGSPKGGGNFLGLRASACEYTGEAQFGT